MQAITANPWFKKVLVGKGDLRQYLAFRVPHSLGNWRNNLQSLIKHYLHARDTEIETLSRIGMIGTQNNSPPSLVLSTHQ